MRLVATAVMVLLVSACGDDGPAAMDAGVDGQVLDAGRRDTGPRDAGERPTSVRCGTGDPSDAGSPCSTTDGGAPLLFIADRFNVVSPGVDGLAPGFDLDGLVSDGSDAASCFSTDFSSPPPDSEPGVDSQVGRVVADVNLDNDIEEALREAIDAGELLPLVWVSGVDDMDADDCVEVGIVYGSIPGGGVPETGLDGRFTPDQTFDVDATWFETDRMTPRYRFRGAIVEGRLEALGNDLQVLVPFPPDAVIAAFHVYGPRLRLSLSDAGLANGVMGGSLDGEEFIDAVAGDLTPLLQDALRSVVHEQTDLTPVDEICTCVSVSFAFDGMPAILGSIVD